MSDLHRQAAELRNVAKHLQALLANHGCSALASDVVERAEQVLNEVVRVVPEQMMPGPIAHKSEWD